MPREPRWQMNYLLNSMLYYKNLKKAEFDLYSLPDRHLNKSEINIKVAELTSAIESFQNRMPSVYDPFTGGGAIPLEAAHLGCQSYGNDLNPVAHIIEKASLEFPQKYGKPIIYSKEEFIRLYGEDYYQKSSQGKISLNGQTTIKNRLSFDVEFYARKLLSLTEEVIDKLYPADKT